MKKIGIDARLYFQTGVGVYLRNFLHFLEKMDLPGYEFYVYVMNDDLNYITFTNPHFIKRGVSSRWHTFSEQFVFLGELNKDNLDLMHFTYFSYPVFYYRKFIATIHDVTPWIFRTGKASTRNPLVFNLKHRAFRFVLTSQVHNATKIITPTNSVKDEIGRIYGSKLLNKITPIYEGVDFDLLKTEENTELRHRFPEPFMLYVGNFYPHKNVERLVEVYSQLDETVPLILVGPNNYFSERIKYNLKKKEIKNIFMFNNAKTADMIYFFKHAQALINPSLSEGFGLPLIEAANFNKPILASNLPVFKELLGDKYISFDPKNRDDMKSKIKAFIRNGAHQVDYSGILDKYSFEKMTKEIVEMYKSTV